MSELLLKRAFIIKKIRDFFNARGFIETDTPALVCSPGMEVHIRPLRIQIDGAYLHTSPEFAMKKILANGFSKIFQITKVYRDEPKSNTHHPEFTMIEWYRTNSKYEEIMIDVENLFYELCMSLYGDSKFHHPNKSLQDISIPFLRLSVNQAFKEFLGKPLIQLLDASEMLEFCIDKKVIHNKKMNHRWDDMFFLLMMNFIEPALKNLNKPVILYDYPKSQAALSNIKKDELGFEWAMRFEIYAGGLELGNAFDELVNSNEQRLRFTNDMNLRNKIYGDSFQSNPIDESFLKAIDKLPPSAGIAIGIDRLIMYLLGVDDIRKILWQESYTESN